MIISASRRTDIPAFYSDWFMRRLREGVVLVRNPMNFHQVAKIALSPETVDCIVFWSKNPGPLLTRLEEIEGLGYHCFFLFTLTPYDYRIETMVPGAMERIATFRALARRVGKARVIWRYDPILITDRHSTAFHAAAFAGIARSLEGSTEKCIVSFIEMYRKCRRNMQGLGLLSPPPEDRINLVCVLQSIAASHGIALQTCADGGELTVSGIPPGKCIDDDLVARITGTAITAVKDKNQRSQCGCVASVDIGAYNSCPHACLYCYANGDRQSIARNVAAHNPDSPLLFGNPETNDKISARPLKPMTRRQGRLF